LTQLHINGLAIIESLKIDFSKGFNVITGETGAGKSILIKALNFLLGAKASADTVRHGRDSATVSGQFILPAHHKVTACLEAYGIPLEGAEGSGAGKEMQTIIVRRVISSKGRSQAWINDTPVTSGTLREFADALVDVFAQHENHKLLDADGHVAIVDQFLDDRAIPGRVQSAFDGVSALIGDLRALSGGFAMKQRDADYLAFRCEELRKFSPSIEDHDKTKAFCDQAKNITYLVSSLRKASAIVDEGGGDASIERLLREAGRVLGQAAAKIPSLQALSDQAFGVAAQAADLSAALASELSGCDASEEDVDAAQARLAGYQGLFRKMGVLDVESLVAGWQRMEEEVRFIDSAAKDATVLLDRLEQAAAAFQKEAGQLSAARKKASQRVAKAVGKELSELAMKDARLEVDFVEATSVVSEIAELKALGESVTRKWQERVLPLLKGVSSTGAEKAQFLLSANAGEPALPLHKVASGGEVSRIMLALKKALAVGADTCILVFDEIDTGISGRVADIVGRKLAELADGFQVICISHLPQVAAYADSHFLVHKYGNSNRTESTITRLDAEKSRIEIARLLSGDEVTDSSLAHAATLVKKARHERPSLT
jgi:DNA repair protein RecN (Recombination protein N)